MSHWSDTHPVIEKVRRSLGRTTPTASPPAPPELPEAIVRLAQDDAGLVDLFVQRASAAKLKVSRVTLDTLAAAIVEFVRAAEVRSLCLHGSRLFEGLDLSATLSAAGVRVMSWSDTTLDAVYDVDAALTDVTYAVAETGSLLIRADARHGRSLSLVPNIHIAVVEARQILPDLIDAMAAIKAGPWSGANVFITGPSKTADIEMNLVVGVHGPGVVAVFVVEA